MFTVYDYMSITLILSYVYMNFVWKSFIGLWTDAYIIIITLLTLLIL